MFISPLSLPLTAKYFFTLKQVIKTSGKILRSMKVKMFCVAYIKNVYPHHGPVNMTMNLSSLFSFRSPYS